MGDYDMKHGFPIAEVAKLYQQKPMLEQQLENERQQNLQSALSTFSQGVKSMAGMKQRITAAMTLAKDPNVQSALGGNQEIPTQVTTGPDGNPVMRSMTAQGGPGMDPIQNQNPRTPALTPEQIEPLLGGDGRQDYFKDAVSAQNQSRLQSLFNNKSNVVTPVVGPDGAVTYNRTTVQPGATVKGPVRLSQPGGGRSAPAGANEFNQLANLRKQYVNQQQQYFDPADPQRAGIQGQIDSIDARLGQIHPLPRGTPGANTASGSPASAGSLPQQAAASLQEGHNTTFANGQTWTLQNGQPTRVK